MDRTDGFVREMTFSPGALTAWFSDLFAQNPAAIGNDLTDCGCA
jgi:hypothetical protein